MTTDNRTNEPTDEQVEAAAKTLHETRNPWFGAYGDWDAAGLEIKKAFRDSAHAALLAATIPQPVIDETALMDALREAFIDEAMTEDSTAGIWIVETPLEDALPGLARAVVEAIGGESRAQDSP